MCWQKMNVISREIILITTFSDKTLSIEQEITTWNENWADIREEEKTDALNWNFLIESIL